MASAVLIHAFQKVVMVCLMGFARDLLLGLRLCDGCQ
jgi:hypothetical protein